MYAKIEIDEVGIYLNCLHSIKVEQMAKVFVQFNIQTVVLNTGI